MKLKFSFPAALALLFLGLTCPQVLSAQDKPPAAFIIAGAEYRIHGFTLKPFLEEFLAIETGKTFADIDSLQAYVDSLTRALVSNRIFQEKSFARMDILEGEAPRKVILTVETYNSMSALAVPLVKYNSTDGLSLVLRYKDFNFLGTLEPLSINLDYYAESNQVEAATYFTLPYDMLGSRWKLEVAEDFIYTEEKGIIPNGTVSLSSTYPFRALGLAWHASPLFSHLYERDYLRHTLTGGLSAGFRFRAGLDWSVSANTYLNDQYVTGHYPYITNGISLSTGLKLATLPWFGALSFSPSAGLFGTYGIQAGKLTDAGWSLGGSIGFGRVDSIRNFRKGAAASLSVSYSDHLIAAAPTDEIDLTASFSATAFEAFNPILGFNLRMLGYWFGTWTLVGENPSFDWEEYIRGVKEPRYGDLGLIANIEFPVNFAQGYFFGSERFDAEVFLVPFIDGGYIRRSPSAPFPDRNDLVLTAGLEITVFPEYARAFIYRLSAGYDIMRILNGEDPTLEGIEAWLGLGLHF